MKFTTVLSELSKHMFESQYLHIKIGFLFESFVLNTNNFIITLILKRNCNNITVTF